MFNNRDITISLLRGDLQDTVRNAVLQAVAHFHVCTQLHDLASTVDVTDGSKVCKFDTLTFEQLGEVIQLPISTSAATSPPFEKARNVQRYHNIKDDFVMAQLKMYCSSSTAGCGGGRSDGGAYHGDSLNSSMETAEDPYYFPGDVFDSDVEFLELPPKKIAKSSSSTATAVQKR